MNLRTGSLICTVMWVVSALQAGTVSSVLDSGGRRVSSSSYAIDGSLGSLGGVGTSAAPYVARHGYAGQITDVKSLSLSATPSTINESGTRQLGARATLDDGTILSLSNTSVVWSLVAGPLASVNATGLATASVVYQDTTGTVRGDYLGKSGTLSMTVLNVAGDDFGTYAGDGMDDAWQVRHFGLGNPNAAPGADPDHDGVVNSLEFVADTIPTNALSRFVIERATNRAGINVLFQSSASRKYTLYYRTNLVSGTWTNIPTQTDVTGSGGVSSLSDPATPTTRRFYRVGVRLP